MKKIHIGEIFLRIEKQHKFTSSITSIYLSSTYFKDTKLLKQQYNKSVDFNIHPQNTDYKAIIIHEYGHSLGEYLQNSKNISRLQIKKEVLKRANYKAKDVKEKLSEYATRNTNEFFAEAFSEYLDSPKPRKIAKIFGEYIDEILKN